MTRILISHSTTDAPCAEQVRQGLQAKGYATGSQATSLQMSDILASRTLHTEILGCATFILLWSHSAAKSEAVEEQLLLAMRLKKPIIPVLLDNEPLPNSLLNIPSVSSQASCADIVPLLFQQPLLPPAGSTDPLIMLWERAANDLLSKRKESVDEAKEMLAQNLHRDAVLALLKYLADNDLMNSVREKAQEAIDADTKRQMPASPLSSPFKPQDERHIFGVRCKNGHVTYFDKRRVCKLPKSTFHRLVQSTEGELDELDLECGTCHEPLTVRIDCKGYK